MPENNIPEIKRCANIGAVWLALGGGELRRGRGQAFWRDGDGYNVAINAERGTWHDFVSNEGGDVIALVETARGCDFRAAIGWLANFAGLSIRTNNSNRPAADTDWPTDLKWATWWKISAELLAEWILEELPGNSPKRRGPTSLLATIRLGDGAALVNEYRDWRRREPQLTTAMAQAGRRSDARVQRRLAEWIVRTYGAAKT
jgi:hypothetical protein